MLALPSRSTLLASTDCVKALPSRNNHYTLACIEIEGKRLYVISIHLSAMGYIDSKEDVLRVQQAKEIMDTGNLVSDEIMLGIISERLGEPDAADGFILDGFPRTGQQALDLEDLLDQIGSPLDTAVLMDVDFEILMKRLTGRRTCSITGRLLNVYFSSQQELDECTDAGGELVQRDDDTEETIKSRLDVYRRQTEPLVEYYRTRDKLKVVDADGSIDAVYERFLRAVNQGQ